MKKDLNPIAIPQDYAEKCITNKPLKNLTFGKQKIVISDEELIKLENLYKHYVNTFGVEIGFVNYILKQVPVWNL